MINTDFIAMIRARFWIRIFNSNLDPSDIVFDRDPDTRHHWSAMSDMKTNQLQLNLVN